MSAWIGLVILVIAGLVLFVSHDAGGIAGVDNADFARIMTGVALLIFIGGGAFVAYRGQGAKAVRDAAIWLSVALGLVAVYSFRHDFQALGQRVAGELLPGTPIGYTQNSSDRAVVRIRKQFDGQFVARTHVNGVAINMMVDTGASSVVLRPEDARRIGIDVDRLTYTVPVSTANGQSMAAPVTLKDITVGTIGARRIQALVARPGKLRQSLLGMSFLNRLRSYEFERDVLTLRG